MLKTLAVILLLWVVALVAIPSLIVPIQHAGKFDASFLPEQKVVGFVIVAAGALIVVWSSLTLAIARKGTPLDADPEALVTAAADRPDFAGRVPRTAEAPETAILSRCSSRHSCKALPGH